MEEMRRGVPTWQEELASLMDGGLQYDDGSPIGQDSRSGFESVVDGSGSGSESTESLKEQVTGFMKSWGEMLMDLAVGCKDVVQQTLVSEDSVVVRKLRKPAAKLRFLNEYLPEDRDPAHAWPVIFFVFLIALAGIPGVKDSLLKDYGVRLVSYDLPGFGESDPHRGRNLSSSASDMIDLASALGIAEKFWLLGYSSGSMHAWATMRYFPDRIAGVAMIAPMINPYEASMTKEETAKTWELWLRKRKFKYFLARRWPSLLPFFYRRSFLSGYLQPLDQWILPDFRLQKKCKANGVLSWLMSMYSESECELVGFGKPIHIWQGMEDRVAPPSVTDYISRVIPEATVHRLPNEGHFSYFFFCDECHKEIFSALFGEPQGPVELTEERTETHEPDQPEIGSSNTSTTKG
ncbi:hypothetical protein IGI04_003874 [Brassica rapa subsp. trilocularis]|uniref:AB hydrolase-1 domain-containing protein n=1 Tax=Brassica rapa subsp. trilocularis TaxID=1813537 RepID=A0ABQ7NZM7_BRACM|nr:hypothetical protein IGI04_003874 [Brassica rapa subsp. trilocularis]